MVEQRPDTELVVSVGEFFRPEAGLTLSQEDVQGRVRPTGLPAWKSNGGQGEARGLPFALEIHCPVEWGSLEFVELLGIFALNCGPTVEPPGTIGAVFEIGFNAEPAARFELVNGRHYQDAVNADSVHLSPGDGTSLEPVGTVQVGDTRARVDLLRIDVPPGPRPSSFTFRDLGSAASFVVFDAVFSSKRVHRCPFHPDFGGIPLSEIPAIVRVGDRVRMIAALCQLENGILSTQDLDDARGKALTFLAVVTAATLETGGSHEMHRVQLEAARSLDRLQSKAEIAEATMEFVQHVAQNLFRPARDPNADLIDRVLAMVNRNYAKRLTDHEVARHIGLSTSHFRHLFREATGQPFHKYLMALRLEKAHALISSEGLSVTEVAEAVGFTAVSHFSRAFTGRFSVRPSEVRATGFDSVE